MKLELQINSRAINDTSRALAGTGVMITPPVDENFWLFRVPVSAKQAIVGFPKFSVIGVGFQHETDWNTNLPSSAPAAEIYDHIKHNKGDKRISRHHCIEAISLIKEKALEVHKSEAIERLQKTSDDVQRLDIIGRFLRRTGSHAVAEAISR